jgi:hypothetical protein
MNDTDEEYIKMCGKNAREAHEVDLKNQHIFGEPLWLNSHDAWVWFLTHHTMAHELIGHYEVFKAGWDG